MLQEASNTLKLIGNAMQTKSQTTDEEVAFANFIVTKVRRITNPTVRYEVEDEIGRLLYNGIQKSLQ